MVKLATRLADELAGLLEVATVELAALVAAPEDSATEDSAAREVEAAADELGAALEEALALEAPEALELGAELDFAVLEVALELELALEWPPQVESRAEMASSALLFGQTLFKQLSMSLFFEEQIQSRSCKPPQLLSFSTLETHANKQAGGVAKT